MILKCNENYYRKIIFSKPITKYGAGFDTHYTECEHCGSMISNSQLTRNWCPNCGACWLEIDWDNFEQDNVFEVILVEKEMEEN